ncbi:MAG: hypothetical protein ACYTCV_06775, partial [Planctomycetota bacterium]
MKNKILEHSILTLLLMTSLCFAEFDAREEIIKLMQKNGLKKYLDAPVTVTQTDAGCLSIRDKGIFAFQHELLKPEISADPNVVIKKSVTINPKADKLVIVVHGWMDKG